MKDIPSHVEWVQLEAASSLQENSSLEAPETVCKKMLRGIKGIIFDFDGTLFDNSRIAFYLITAFLPDWRRIWKERLVRNRLAGQDFLKAEEYYKFFFAELGKLCSRPPEKMRKWYFERYMPRMAKVLKKHYAPREGVKEMLDRLSKNDNLKTAIYSDYPFLKERLESLGLSTAENIKLYGPDSFGTQKPAVRSFLEISKEMGVYPENILVIGDREETDGIGAFHAKMHFFCLETGNKRYFRFDPNRAQRNKPQGPSLLMYAGKWEQLNKLLTIFF